MKSGRKSRKSRKSRKNWIFLLYAAVCAIGQAQETRDLDRGESVMKALARAYPDRLGPAEYRDGDWAVSIRGVYYYYAQGRILPEILRYRVSEYDPQPFYAYPANLPQWKDPEPEESARIKRQAEQRRLRPPKRSQHFYDALWRASTRAESYDRVKTIRFLGKNTMVHYAILEELALVEERITEAAQTNPAVRQWVASINTVTGWNWRNIAETESRSFHAYGAAVDVLPKISSLETYWLWTSRSIPEWWTVPYSRRLHPPDAVVKAFESYGFIWGGKWLNFDTMHFEYRPEILILNNLPPRGPR
ncbi:MAG: M15 family metallopeptidase [Spirochaetaceae bacterium]|nr:M15 family metallopeptidase [Spirochaetaceae bacterium]